MCNLYLFLIVTLNASGSIKRNNYNNKNNDRRCRLLITKKARRGTKKQKVCIGRTTTLDVLHPGWGVRVLRSWIDRDDRKISAFFWVGEFWQVFFCVAEFQHGFFWVLYHLMLSGNVLKRGWGLHVGPVVFFGGEEWLF